MDWSGIATAVLDRERARLGLPSREALATKRAAEERAAAESASNIETAGVNRDLLRTRLAALPEEQRLAREREIAQTGYYNAQAERAGREATAPQSDFSRIYSITDPEEQKRAIATFNAMHPRAATGGSGSGGGLSPAVESNIVNRLTGQWDKANQTVNVLRQQRDLMHSGLQAARRGDMAAGSQAVLVTFQKILDPTSVVRESEYARSAAGQSLLSQIQGAADRLAMGGAGVPVAELEKFANLADEFVNNATSGPSLKMIRDRIGLTADRYKIPHEVIFGSEAPAAIVPPPSAPPATGSQIKIQRSPSTGKTRYSTDGGATWQLGLPPQ